MAGTGRGGKILGTPQALSKRKIDGFANPESLATLGVEGCGPFHQLDEHLTVLGAEGGTCCICVLKPARPVKEALK